MATDRRADVRLSKFLSLVLRHDPERIGLELDPGGWADVDDLVGKARAVGVPLSRTAVTDLVAASDKQRFALSADMRRIRANQGHSISVDLGLEPTSPPSRLYHGTATKALGAIRREGLKPGSRQYVHLSGDAETALAVGRRHGKPIAVDVDAARMAHDGFAFYLSRNGVWLTARVPPTYLLLPSAATTSGPR